MIHRRYIAGFTLLETILALALSSFLLVVIFSLVESTARYHVTGNDQVLASERLLGVLQDLRFDLRSVSADTDWMQPAQLSEPIDEIDATIAKFSQQLQLKDLAAYAEPITLAGERNWILILPAVANPRMISRDAAAIGSARHIVWAIGGANATVIPTHDDHGRVLTTRLSDLPAGKLWRIELNPSSSSSTSASQTMIAQAKDVQFRYFDGQQWHATWNSSSQKALPRAVEVTLVSIDSSVRSWTIALPTASSTTKRSREVR